jgi:hypothetical protein
VTQSAVRANLDDPPIHIRPTIPAISLCQTKEPFGFWPLRPEGVRGSLTLAARDIRALSGVGADAKASFLRLMSGMQVDEGDARLLQSVTERIIGWAFRVANALGHGFGAKV